MEVMYVKVLGPHVFYYAFALSLLLTLSIIHTNFHRSEELKQ